MRQSGLNADETGHKESGKRHYGWIFTNENLTFLTIESSRGKKVLKHLFPEGFDGDITSDRYAAYNVFNIDQRQVCWAHLLRDFTRFSNSADPFTMKIGTGLLHQANRMFQVYHKYKKGKITPSQFLLEISDIKKRVELWIYRGSEVFDRPRLNRFCKNLERIRPALWNFAYSDGK